MTALRKPSLGPSSGEAGPTRPYEAPALRSSGHALVGKPSSPTHVTHVFSIGYRDARSGPRRSNSPLTSWPTPPSRCLRGAVRVVPTSARIRRAVAVRRMGRRGMPRVTSGVPIRRPFQAESDKRALQPRALPGPVVPVLFRPVIQKDIENRMVASATAYRSGGLRKSRNNSRRSSVSRRP
jgi:hypothetical protein